MRLTILSVVCAGLLVVVGYDLFFSSQQSLSVENNIISNNIKQRNENISRKIAQRARQNPYQNLQIKSMTATRERPLFTQSRKAPVIPNKVTSLPRLIKKPPKKETIYLLMGILKNGTKSVALLQEKDTGRYYRVGEGDILGGNRVTDIFVKEIKIERKDGTSSTLKLRFNK